MVLKLKKRWREVGAAASEYELPANKVDYWLLIAGSCIGGGDCKEQAAGR